MPFKLASLRLFALALTACCLAGAWRLAAADARFTVSGLGDCEKIAKDAPVPASPHFWDPKTKTLSMFGGRNEMVAAQLVLTAAADVGDVNVTIGDLKSDGATIPADPNLQLSQELYQYVPHGNWDWGPPSEVLPSKKWYPDVLVPFTDPYSTDHKPVGAPFTIKAKDGGNQGVWIDLYIPKDAVPGRYTAAIAITVAKVPVFQATLQLTVHPFTIPDQTHVDGYGELYGGCYQYHGVSYKQDPQKWWTIASRYHQMAHQHRFVVREIYGGGPRFGEWDNYTKYYGQLLDGTLFSKANGYYGPGANTGVAFWTAPFDLVNNGKMVNLTDAQLKTFTAHAKEFWDYLKSHHWDDRRYLAYMFDETKTDANALENTKKLQDALDLGAGVGHINLIWTSHTDPQTLAAKGVDFRTAIRWWVPNTGACDPEFLVPEEKLGKTVWFYHNGHPCCGVHGVNASGVELRTWGTICWRYKINGSFWWATECFYNGDKDPLQEPVYSKDDTRWGNGVLFYPGSNLPDVGLPAIAGPLACIRMNDYRRGLEDYEYGWLLKQAGEEAFADAAIKKLIPVALTDAHQPGTKNTPWDTNVNDWYQMREDLAAELDKHPAAKQ
ncbi:MAG: glycoside hydrolase domain-containing protein [Planctomycetota bacterium]